MNHRPRTRAPRLRACDRPGDARGRRPGATRGRPLLVFLHGHGCSDTTYTEDGAFFRALASLGRRATIVAFPTVAKTATGTIARDGRRGSFGADLTEHECHGAHEQSYWDRHWRAYLRFYAGALAAC